MDAVIYFLVNLCEFFSDFFSSLGQLLVDSFFWCFTTLSEFLAESCLTMITTLLESFGVKNTLWVVEIYETMNFFVPLNELFSILLLCFTFWINILTVKVILKLIPTIY